MAEQDRYWVPSNYNDSKKIRGIPYRNIIEGAVVCFIEWKIIQATPFVDNIKLITAAIVIISTALIFLFGIKGESVIQFIYAYLCFRKKRRVLHLKRPDELVRKEQKDTKAEELMQKLNTIIATIKSENTNNEKVKEDSNTQNTWRNEEKTIEVTEENKV